MKEWRRDGWWSEFVWQVRDEINQETNDRNEADGMNREFDSRDKMIERRDLLFVMKWMWVLRDRGRWRRRGLRKWCELVDIQQFPQQSISTTAGTSPATVAAVHRHRHLAPAGRRPLHQQSTDSRPHRRRRRILDGGCGPDDDPDGCSRRDVLRSPPESPAARSRQGAGADVDGVNEWMAACMHEMARRSWRVVIYRRPSSHSSHAESQLHAKREPCLQCVEI